MQPTNTQDTEAERERLRDDLTSDEEAVALALGVEWDEDAELWWLPAEPGPIACDTLADAVAAALRLAESDGAALRREAGSEPGQ